MAEATYFVKISGRANGPFTAAQMRRLIVDRTISPDSPVQLAGTAPWRPLREFTDLIERNESPRSQPPPLAPRSGATSPPPKPAVPPPPPPSAVSASQPIQKPVVPPPPPPVVFASPPAIVVPPVDVAPSPSVTVPAQPAPRTTSTTRSLHKKNLRRWLIPGLGAGLVGLLLIIVLSVKKGSLFDSSLLGYAGTVLQYCDRDYKNDINWTPVKGLEVFRPVGSQSSPLHSIAGWDDEHFWVADESGEIYIYREGKWTQPVDKKPEHAKSPSLRAINPNTLYIAGVKSGEQNNFYRLDDNKLTNLGVLSTNTDSPKRAEICPLSANLTFCLSWDPNKILDIGKLFSGKFSPVGRNSNDSLLYLSNSVGAPLNNYYVGEIRATAVFSENMAYGVARKHQNGNTCYKLAKCDGDKWKEIRSLQKDDNAIPEINTAWIGAKSANATPFVILCGPGDHIEVHDSEGSRIEPNLKRPALATASPDSMNLIKVWGVSEKKFWMMDKAGNGWVCEGHDTDCIFSGGLENGSNISLEAVWISPKGTIFALSSKKLYKLN